MRAHIRQWMPVLKIVFTIAILLAFWRHFRNDLAQSWEVAKAAQPGWLVLSGVLYILGLGMSALYWFWLLRNLGQSPQKLAAIRAYYIGHLGKYLPGKAWALVLRATLIRGPGVRLGVAGLSSFYEVLTTMASGVLLAAILFGLQVPSELFAAEWKPLRDLVKLDASSNPPLNREGFVLFSLGLLACVGLPIVPAAFNWLVHHISLPFKETADAPFPRVRARSLLEGLLLTGGGWCLLGASMWATFQAVLPQSQPLTSENLGFYTACMGLAYVAGFIIFLIPSGLGVREYFLALFLVPQVATVLGSGEEDARITTVGVVLLLRLVWTVAEGVVCGIVYWFPGPAASTIEGGKRDSIERG